MLRLALLIGVVTVLYFGKRLLLPLTVGALMAMLLNPLDVRLRSWGLPPGFAIAGSVGVLLLFFAGLFFAVGQQADNFAESWPQTQQRLVQRLDALRQNSGLGELIPEITSKKKSQNRSEDGGKDLLQQVPISGSGIMSFLSGTFGVLGDFLLMLVYVVLFLSQKERLREFLLRRAPAGQRKKASQALDESRDIVQKYLRGRLILIAILTVLYSVGFLIIGLDYAILIAILVAVLSIIPYLGNLIGGVFAMALAFAGGNSVLGVVATMSLAQMLESYVLTPLIVGDEVDINPLTTIICVVGMTLLWGPVGAIIAIPLFAILRIICSHVDGLRDYAYLLGQE
ncbi:MAG: AI-2E family transporter [Bacteroidota bacterium]